MYISGHDILVVGDQREAIQAFFVVHCQVITEVGLEDILLTLMSAYFVFAFQVDVLTFMLLWKFIHWDLSWRKHHLQLIISLLVYLHNYNKV